MLMGKFLNGIWNTLGLAPRSVGSVWIVALDTVKTGANILTDAGHVAKDTSDKLWEVLSSSRNTGKWYNKLYQVPAGVAIGAGTLVEGAVRMVLEPVKNAFLNVRDTGGNFFINIGNALKQTFRTDKPVSDFRFEKIQTKTTSNKNWLSKLAWWKNSNTQASSPATTAAPQTSNTTASQAPNNNQLAGLQNQIATLSTQMEQFQSRLSTLQTENQQLKAENQQLKAENQQLKAQAQQTSTQNQQKPTQAQQTSAQNQQTSTQNQTAQAA